MSFMKNYFLFILLLLTTNCTVGPQYKSAKIDTSNSWNAPSSNKNLSYTTAKIDIEWWKNFQDPELNTLIAKAIQNNIDIKIAEAKIRKAVALRQISSSYFFPSLDIESSVQKADGTY